MGPAIIPVATLVGELWTVQTVVTAVEAGAVGAAFGAGKRVAERYIDSKQPKANKEEESEEESEDVYYPAPKSSRFAGDKQYNYRIGKRR